MPQCLNSLDLYYFTCITFFFVVVVVVIEVLSDSLNHASIIDGIRLCKAQRFRYEHNDMADLEAKLIESQSASKSFVCACITLFPLY